MTTENAKAQILATFKARIDNIKALISAHITDESTYVVYTGNPAVYFKEGQNFGGGVEGASRYSLGRAEFWASVVQNGRGEQGQVKLFADALIDSLMELKEAYRQVSEA